MSYLHNYKKYDILTLLMKSTQFITSRKNSFFSIITWVLMSISITILYRYIQNTAVWSPSKLNYIDTIYEFTQVLILIIVVVHVVSSIFREIEHSFLVDGAVIKRFLPLIKVITISMIWITGCFYILDSLHINTSSILTGAGIG